MMTEDGRTNVLFVCLGNICRSPLAEGIFSSEASRKGKADQVSFDSAGTGAWHVGERPDRRSIAVARHHGIDIGGQRCRQVEADDFEHFDLILAMDSSNLKALEHMAPAGAGARTALLMLECTGRKTDIPDPYYGGDDGFEKVYRMIEEAAGRFIDRLE